MTNVELNEKQIDNLFDLIQLNSNDIFYDLGSGTGLTVINACLKRNVKKAIGIEIDKKYLKKAKKLAREILSKESLGEKVDFWYGDYSKFDKNKYVFDISDATIVYNSLAPSGKSLFYDKQFLDKPGVKIVKKDLPLVGYTPVKISRKDPNSQFFMMLTPLSRYKIHSKRKWSELTLGEKNVDINDVLEYYETLWRNNNGSKIPFNIICRLKTLIDVSLPNN